MEVGTLSTSFDPEIGAEIEHEDEGLERLVNTQTDKTVVAALYFYQSPRRPPSPCEQNCRPKTDGFASHGRGSL